MSAPPDPGASAFAALGPAAPGPAQADPSQAGGATARDAAKRWPLSRIVGVTVVALLLFSVAAVSAGGIALLTLHHDRARVLDTFDPAVLQAQQLDIALLNEETGVRGYALSANQSFLAPYTQGSAAEKSAITSLQQEFGQLPSGALLAHPLRGTGHQRDQPHRQAGDQSRHHGRED
jgi:hypothetical protein